MAAILGISPAVVQDACKRAAEGEVCSAANLNSPEQTVISGHANAVKRAVEIASQSGAKRAVMSGRFPLRSIRRLMMPAQEKLEKDLMATQFCGSADAVGDQRGRRYASAKGMKRGRR